MHLFILGSSKVKYRWVRMIWILTLTLSCLAAFSSAEQLKRISNDGLFDMKTAHERYNWHNYNRLDQIVQQLYQWKKDCPDGFQCEVRSIGQSYEGRDLLVFKLSKPTDRPRKAVWLDSLIHAREWLAGAVLMKVANKLIRQRNTFPTAKHLTDTYDWYFMPVVNPDGYVYTHSTDRFWRKSRNLNANSTCRGVDLNRNFEYKWDHGGVSHSPCDSMYLGDSPVSEPEVYHYQAEALRLNDSIQAWVSMHTCAQMWLGPYSFETSDGVCAYTPDYEDQVRVSDAAAAACGMRHGTVYKSGTFCDTLYLGSGTSSDYVYAIAGVKYSYLAELGGGRFDPPPSVIQPSFMEFWDGLLAMLLEIEKV